MTADIGQELYEKIKAEFEGRVSANGYIKAVTKRIAEGTATMNDVSLYAKALGSEVRLAIAYNISPEVLPEGQMFYNIAQKILDPLLHDNHAMVNDIAAQVQKKLDERKGIRIKPQKAPFPEDRLGSVLSAASEQGLDEATMKRRMSAPAETMTQSFADDYMKENAKFRTRAGFKEYIVRKEDGKCCEWCSKLAGRYLYPESTPHDVFRRHDNCGCTVTYEDGEMRTRQQVWSKRDWSDEEEQKYLEASDKHKRTMAAMKEDLRLYREGKLSPVDANISYQENRRALANIRNLRDRTPVKFTPAQAEALENLVLANSARAKNPIDIFAESGIIEPRESGRLKISMQFFAEKDIENQESGSLRRAMRKYKKRIEEHKEYISNPKSHCPNWNELSDNQKSGLIRHWEKEIRNFEESIQNRIDELKKRGEYDE